MVRRGRTIASVITLLLATVAMAQDNQVVDRVIANVDGEIILESEVLQFVQDVVLRNRSAYNDQQKIKELHDNVLQELINQKILLSIAQQDTTIIVEDREVDRTLDERLNQIVSEVGGEAKLEQYYGKPLRTIRRDYRKQVRDGLLIEKLRSKKLMSVSVTKPEVDAYYEKNQSEIPDVPAQIRLAHILIPIEPTKDAQEQAKARADSIYRLLLTGQDFAALAMQLSDDKASGAKGGLLGTSERGDLVPEYEEIAYNLNEGEISEPVKSRFGYHIILLNWRKGEKISSSHILVSLKPTPADEERALNTVKELRQKIVEQGMSFADVAKQSSQDSETGKLGGDLGWFDLTNMPDEFRVVAANLKPGDVSEPFKTRFGIHLLTATDRHEGRKLDLNSDWERLSRMALAEKQDKVYKSWVESLRTKVYVEVAKD